MGRDKAGVLVHGQPLWERQLATLGQIQPAEIFISGRLDGPYAGAGVAIVEDITPGRGPLSGLEASLQRATHPLVLVLAIDLPEMNAAFLSRLIGFATRLESGRGRVPRLNGRFEPLAAVYPRSCLPIVERCVHSEDLSMQGMVHQAWASALLTPHDVLPDEAALFRNINSPADVDRISKRPGR